MWSPWSISPLLLLFYLFALWTCQIAWRYSQISDTHKFRTDGALRVDSRISTHQHIHDELLRLEALALTRLPWYINTTDERALLGVGPSSGISSGLKRRTATPEPDQGDMTLSLWRNSQFKVPVNNMFVEFDITSDKTVVMTSSTCYGCTAVVMCSGLGKICIFAHFRQSNDESDTWAQGSTQDVDFSIYVLDPINNAIKQYKDRLAPGGPFCVIFTPATSQSDPTGRSFYYRPRIEGPNSINSAITEAFPSSSILNIGYNYQRAQGDWSDDYAWGKLVLEWKGSASSCAGGGSSVLNVFAEDSWWRSLRFDDDGNPVTVDNTPCQSLTGSDDEFEPDL
ncbi:hypothetical protein N431DRAFT_468301 [Stipitochalara longipes BDJ]|nr:hypothetical protein N431DRAFT_468301 [Stipitochalara longipes BDJ]